VAALKALGFHIDAAEETAEVRDVKLELMHPADSDNGRDLKAACPSSIHKWLGHAPKPPSDAKVDRIIARYGADVIM
jgi:hypothetical protein